MIVTESNDELIFSEDTQVIVEMPYVGKASVNQCYGRSKTGRTFMRAEAKQWKNIAKLNFANAMDKVGVRFETDKIKIMLNARFPKRNRKPDAENFLKLFSDAIAEELGVDDHNFVTGVGMVSHDNDYGILIYTVSLQGTEVEMDL